MYYKSFNFTFLCQLQMLLILGKFFIFEFLRFSLISIERKIILYFLITTTYKIKLTGDSSCSIVSIISEINMNYTNEQYPEIFSN
jgi:hypothetical protein